ncbi:MAG: hypothetical protein MJ197_00860 [Bacteroidales bacterium]|nr:hypothetical protein [Bacteroidales bacterium]
MADFKFAMRYMRLVVILLLAVTTRTAICQTVSYKAQNETLPTILHNICNKAGFQVSYNSDIFNNTKYTYTFENKDITTCLSTVLSPNYAYQIIGKQVIITEVTKEKATEQTPPRTKKQTNIQTKIITVYDTIPVHDTVTITQIKTITDTLFVTDTIPFVDTITMKRYETNHLHTTKNCLSDSTSIRLGMNSLNYYNKNDYANSLQDIHQRALGFLSQIDATYKHNNLLLSTGLSLHNCRLINSYKTSYFTDDPTLTYKDTIWYWEFKNVMTYYKYNNGDSVAIQVLDSTYTYTIRENPKKIEHTREKLSTLSWHYVSIPIGLGIHCNITNTISLEPTVALQTHFLIKAQGEIPTEDKESTYKVKDLLKPINYSAAISCNILYSIEKNYSVSIKPWYSITPSLFRGNEFSTKAFVSHWGLVWGFHYTIPYDLF